MCARDVWGVSEVCICECVWLGLGEREGEKGRECVCAYLYQHKYLKIYSNHAGNKYPLCACSLHSSETRDKGQTKDSWHLYLKTYNSHEMLAIQCATLLCWAMGIRPAQCYECRSTILW